MYGLPFKIVTDHKPLEVILNNPRHQAPIRLQKMMVRMLDYEFKVEHRTGKTNISDYTSRHPLPRETCTRRELDTTKDVKQYVVASDIPRAISKEYLVKATENDEELKRLITCTRERKIDHRNLDMKAYFNIYDELAVAEGLVLRGERIVVPRELRETMVKIAHEGHQGIVRTKQLLRAHVWFPRIDKMVEKHVGKCLACQATIPCHTREPLQMSDLPKSPWKKISVDFGGPFPNKDMALVIWDHSHVFYFTTYGILEEVKTDNGPTFNGCKSAKYAQEQGFRHRKVTPGCAEVNGDVERFIQTVKRSARVAKIEGKAFKIEIRRTVGNYRATRHPVTRESPDKLLFGREIRRKLPERVVPLEEQRHDLICESDERKKKQMKAYADERRHALQSSIKIGDRVLLKQNRGNTLTPAYDPRPYAVVGMKGNMITVKRGKEVKSRNSSHCKVLKYAGKEEYDDLGCDKEQQSMNRRLTNRHIEVGKVPGEGNIVMQETHSGPTIAPSEPRRSVRARTSTWETIYRDFEPHQRKWGRCSIQASKSTPEAPGDVDSSTYYAL
ncbi:uncharacterized protein K02A2.6-like [Stylophora pistillata]|uniref:uncharacterized protein K02A2.6-like n=1 Tax=Stylophora pistillata TaxID=50429 RepID=UPI000C03B95F|nr:uncharacterized protein K02A2.6-like [Stylophora pistillata]